MIEISSKHSMRSIYFFDFLENFSRIFRDSGQRLGMISFDQIDSRLEKIGKNRMWLAQESDRAATSIRDALAPNADDSKRSRHLQRALTDAIEAEEVRQSTAPASTRLQNMVLEVEQEQFDRWNAAALSQGKLMRQWAIDGLDALAADELLRAAARAPLPATGTEGK